MTKSETLNQTTKSQFKHQLNPDRVPNATLLYGQNIMVIFDQMTRYANQINKTHHEIPNAPSETLQEPCEDIIMINPTKSIKIAHIKALQDRIKYGPSNHAYCIAIIHNIQQLTKSASNALLKSIEEPPKNTVFFLSTQNKFDIPQTIQSRSQQYHIPEPPSERHKKNTSIIEEISEKMTYISPHDFLEKSTFEKTIYIQSLPYDTLLITNLLMSWQTTLYENWASLQKKEHAFLEKIIEIISNIKYNFNLKLQLLAVTLQIEEDDLQ